MKSQSNVNSGLTCDVHNPSTGVKIRKTFVVVNNGTNGHLKSSVQYLSGDSGDRMILIPETSQNIETGMENSHFNVTPASVSNHTADLHDLLRPGNGVFYTDPYMKEIVRAASDFSVRQYISPTFQPIRLPKSKILTVDSWPSTMAYGGESDADRHFINCENAVKPKAN